MAAAHPQGPYLTRYSRHRTIRAAAYSRSFRVVYIYINPPRPRLLTDLCQTGSRRGGEERGTWIRFMGRARIYFTTAVARCPCSFSIIASRHRRRLPEDPEQMVDLPGKRELFCRHADEEDAERRSAGAEEETYKNTSVKGKMLICY